MTLARSRQLDAGPNTSHRERVSPMTCPKCGSGNAIPAPDEAPPWATSYMKCFACGKRWNQAGRPPKWIGDEADEDAEDEACEPPVPTRSGEDLVALVMKAAQTPPAIHRKEGTMARCRRGSCRDEAADDSVQCPKHRDLQRAANAKYNGRMLSEAGTPKRKSTGRHPLSGSATIPALPSIRAHAPITTAEPRLVNATPARPMDLDGTVFTVIDELIHQREQELVMLRGTKELLEARV